MKFESALVGHIRLVNVIVDKRNKPNDYPVFERAWQSLTKCLELAIHNAKLPIVKQGTQPAYPEHGLIVVDQTDGKKLKHLIRSMRHAHALTTESGELLSGDLMWVVEDPMIKQSQDSIPIQLCDANAYFLRQLIEPNSTVRKHDAKNYFYFLRPILLKDPSVPNDLGVIRI